MTRALLTMFCVCLLTGCAHRRVPGAPSLTLPKPPIEATEPCAFVPLVKRKDGAQGRREVELSYAAKDKALADCEAKRAKLVEAWPG